MNYKNLDQPQRDKLLKEIIGTEKTKLLDKHGLISTPDLKWISRKENSHEQVYFTQSFLAKTDVIGAVFRINKLCFAKLNYFRPRINNYEPLVYKPTCGFAKTELWDSDYLRHKPSGIVIDYRYLQRITKIEEFREFCSHLESFENR